MNTTLYTDDGNTLEAIVEEPAAPSGTVVLCHPHPLHGGTMRAPLLTTITAHALDAGYRVVRFNFRGVGSSTGDFGNGVDERTDVAAAMVAASRFHEPVHGICGWSFGAATALRWHSLARSQVPYVGIAPPVASTLSAPLPEPSAFAPARRRFIIGAKDQFVDPEELASYATAIGAEFIKQPATDHFFVFRYDKLAAAVIDGFGR